MRILFCTTVPSKNYKSWSNIPYLLHKNLEKRGYVVENYVMWEIEPFKTVFNLPIRVLNKFFKLEATYFYSRTSVHFFLTHLYSRYLGLVSSKQDVMIVQGFSYALHNKRNRQILLGDWPSEYLFEKFLKRKPNWLERRYIERETAVIEAADVVITLFPNVREYMVRKYKNKNIYFFGNVVNVDDDVVVPPDIRERKQNSRRLLFIGQPFYLIGALELIAAAQNLRQQGFECEVDIVGIDPTLLGVEYEWLKVHGYLDKAKPNDKARYYELLSNARLFVNTTPEWNGFQALLEAMYFQNPIMVRPNESLSAYFSNLSSFAYLLVDEGPKLETMLAQSFVDCERYMQMSDTSRKSVESSTWNEFTTKLADLLK